MKKTGIKITIMIIISIILTSCNPGGKINKKPDVTQIRSICNLATLECYYHNVAKSTDKSGSWFGTDRKFWIEYTGIAKIGIDMSKVNMEIKDENVTVYLPDAELLEIDICENDLNKDSYIQSADGLLIKNKITANEQTKAIDDAQQEMAKSVKANKTLLANARDRAQKLIENYIVKLSELSGINYQIQWVYEESDSSPAEETEPEETQAKTENADN